VLQSARLLLSRRAAPVSVARASQSSSVRAPPLRSPLVAAPLISSRPRAPQSASVSAPRSFFQASANGRAPQSTRFASCYLVLVTARVATLFD
jgi:hypothetical protein